MRLANAVALLGFATVLVGTGPQPAEARRVHYKVAGHTYWYNPDKRGSRRRSLRHSRSAVEKRQTSIKPTEKAAVADADTVAALPPSRPPALSPSSVPAALSPASPVEVGAIPATSPVPPPPGPMLVNSVTYDFEKGVKTTNLRDGATFVEDFDPKAFFRMLPEAGPTSTSSTLAAAGNPAQGMR